MPDDFVLDLSQIWQYPTVALADPNLDGFVLQHNGIGGPFQSVSAVGLVQGAFSDPTRSWNIPGNIVLGGFLEVIGNVAIGGTLGVDQEASFLGDVNVGGNLGVFGSITSTNGDLSIAGSGNFGGDLTVAGSGLIQGPTFGVQGMAWGMVWIGPDMPPVTSGTPGVFWWTGTEFYLWDGTDWRDLAGRHMEVERWDEAGLYWDDEGWEWW